MRNQVKGSRHKTDYFNGLEWLYKCCMRVSDRIELSGVSMFFWVQRPVLGDILEIALFQPSPTLSIPPESSTDSERPCRPWNFIWGGVGFLLHRAHPRLAPRKTCRF